MTKTKKRVISLLLALCMALTLAPVALADPASPTDEAGLIAALADTSIPVITIAGTIVVEQTMIINRNVTLTGGGTIQATPDPDVFVRGAATANRPYILQIQAPATNVTVENITVAGPSRPAGFSHISGIYITGVTGSVTLDGVTVQGMHNGAPDGVQSGGWGILARNSSNVEILNSLVRDFNNEGIGQVGGNLLVYETTILGDAANSHLQAKNGIQISDGNVPAITTLTNNTISGFRFTGSGWTATAILLMGGTATLEGNTISDSQVAIAATLPPWALSDPPPQVILEDTNFEDSNDTFIRITNGSIVDNDVTIPADRIFFGTGDVSDGGTYNGMSVTDVGSAADLNAAGLLAGSLIVTFECDATNPETAFTAGNVTDNPLAVWTAIAGVTLGDVIADIEIERVGYTLEGWVDENDDEILLTFVLVGPVTVHPVWEPVPPVVTPPPGGGGGGGAAPAPNRAPLEDKLEAAQARSEANYTDESWEALVEAKDAAEAVLARTNPAATQAQLDAAYAALREAYEALERLDGGTTPTQRFTDVSPNNWFYTAVMFVYDRGLMTGTGDTVFAPTVNLNRGMVATILYRMADADVAFEAIFPDVAEGRFYANAVVWAYHNGVVTGFPDGSFRPADLVTRQEFAAMLFRYAELMGYDITVSEDFGLDFPDAGLAANWATSYLEWAVYNGLITGTPQGELNPRGTTTRAECATILMRFVQTFAD